MERKITIAFQKSYICTVLILVLLSLSASPSHASLSFNFYATSCPAAEFMVSNTVRQASSADPTIPGKLLRLLFHDCFVEGCDASVLLQGNGTERNDPANTSLGGFPVIDSAKRVLEIFCPGTVSCADIIALAARDAVAITGGPAFQIPTGRRDGRISDAANVRPNIIDTSFTMNEMLNLFNSKGLSLDDLVTLSETWLVSLKCTLNSYDANRIPGEMLIGFGFAGAHTIGLAHCSAFSDRFQQDSKGKLTQIDASLDRTYAEELMKKCPADASTSKTVNNDPETAFAFDNQYYKNLLAHKGLFQSDSVLLEDGRTRKQVEAFANDQESFFSSWGESFLKLTTIGVKTDDEGEIRQSCSFPNN